MAPAIKSTSLIVAWFLTDWALTATVPVPTLIVPESARFGRLAERRADVRLDVLRRARLRVGVAAGDARRR